MKSIEKQWDNYFEELKVDINDDERNILVGYAVYRCICIYLLYGK